MTERWSCAGVVIASVLCLWAAVVRAADPLSGSESLRQQFQQLSPEQRQAVTRALGGTLPAAAEPPTAAVPVTQPPDTQQAIQPLPVDAAVRRLQAGDTVLLGLSKVPPTDPAAGPPVTEKGIYVLDASGALLLPDVGRIVLAGLSETQAVERLAIEPALAGRVASLQRLPVEPELKMFGQDLFRSVPGTFMPTTDVPVPADYVIGPGDSVLVQLFGKENTQHELTVTRDGSLLFPGIGPLAVAGLSFPQLQGEIQGRVQRQLSGVSASVTLGRIRSIRIFVLGEVETPGSYVVSGMATLTNALFAGSGVKPIGSLRDIQLKRNGRVISRLDLYDLLLRGNTAGDARLLPGDAVFVPPGGSRVGIGGQVRRPAIYELKDERTLDELIALAGGLLPAAYPQKVQIERIEDSDRRVLLEIDLTAPQAGKTALHDGDVVRVLPVLDRLTQVVSVAGQVTRPGAQAWFAGMRLTDLLPSLSSLQPQADARYLLIKRQVTAGRPLELLDADLVAALAGKGGARDPQLQQDDEIRVFARDEDRTAVIEPLLTAAAAESAPDRPLLTTTIDGMVHHPGRYPLAPDMKVSDLLRAAGGLTDRAYTLALELTRHSVIDGERREMSRHNVDLAALFGGDVTKDMPLAAYDQVVVRRIPSWDEAGSIELRGEVRFPGRYPVARGDKLSEVIRRAGGLTPEAYPKAAVFLRESVRAREQESIDQLARRFEHELAQIAPERDDAAAAEGQLLLRQIQATRASGRMVIRLEELLRNEQEYDITVNAGDKLYIPQKPDEVTVVGEVYSPTSHLYDPRLDRDDYIRLSGDVTESGNGKAIYVIHADGSVSPTGGWFSGRIAMGPGDTVVVPVKVERLSKLKVITSVSQILYQLALTAASLDVVGVF